jgi:hypothetical protein
LALLSVLSAIEKQRTAAAAKPAQPNLDLAQQDMSGQLQTIPARHGVATFVPRGRTIKIINTYGKQVVSLWAFGLGAPPEDGDVDMKGVGEEIEKEAEKGVGHKDIDEAAEKLKGGIGERKEKGSKAVEKKEPEGKKGDGGKGGKGDKSTKSAEEIALPEDTEEKEGGAEDPPEQAPEETKTSGKRTWSSYLPSTSYLPSIPYRSKGAQGKAGTKAESAAEKAQNDAASKKWSSYLPSGKSFSTYVPDVKLPDSKEVVSAFKASHYRDPNKSYAEQLYDFSKTPVGAGTLSGMGYILSSS